MANNALPPQQKSRKQPLQSPLLQQGAESAQTPKRAEIDRKRILKSIMNDDADAVAQWIDNAGNKEVALLPDDPLNNSLMHMVAYKGKLSTLRMMWARGMKCSHRNFQGETALHWGVKCKDEVAMRAVILELVTMGQADVDAVTTYGDTPLFYAVADGNLAAVMELCERGASISLKNKDGDGLIHLAISSGNTGTVAYVLERQPGAAQLRDGQGRLPIQLALEYSNEDIIKMVLLAWPLCLGCRTSDGVLLHDVFPQLGLLHLVEGLGFGDGCVWDVEVAGSQEVHQYSVDVTISGTAFYIEGHQTRGSASFEVQLNDFTWHFDEQSLSAIFSDVKGENVLKLTANSLATHKKLLRQLDLARLSQSSYASSTKGDAVESFKVLSLKKSAVPNPCDNSDSENSLTSGRIVRSASASDMAWLEKLDDEDIDLMIKWGVVPPEKAKAILRNRGLKARDGDIILKTVGQRTSALKPASAGGSGNVPVPAAPPPRSKTKGAAVTSHPLPSPPPPRAAKKQSAAPSAQAHVALSATVTAESPALITSALTVPAAYFEDHHNDDAPPPPPVVVNRARQCADAEGAAIHQLHNAVDSGSMNSGVVSIYILWHIILCFASQTFTRACQLKAY
jgi:hypothetical protein